MRPTIVKIIDVNSFRSTLLSLGCADDQFIVATTQAVLQEGHEFKSRVTGIVPVDVVNFTNFLVMSAGNISIRVSLIILLTDRCPSSCTYAIKHLNGSASSLA